MAHRSLRPLPLGWLRLFDCPFGGLTPGGRRGAFLGEARLQRVHQIDDLGLRRFLRLGGDLLAVHLLLDGGEDAVPHLIVILLGVELVRGRLLDQLLGQRELGRLYGHLRNRDVFRAPDLVGVVQLLHRQHTVHRTDQHQVLLAPGGILAHGRAPGFLERLGEERVGPLAALVRIELIGPVEVDPVHLRERHELSDVDGFGGLLVQGLELLWREEHVLALGELVALGHVVPLDDLVVLGTDVLLLEAGAALLVQQVEAPRGGRLARGKEGDGDRDEPEGDGGGGDRAGWHRTETIGRFRRPRNRAACLPFTVHLTSMPSPHPDPLAPYRAKRSLPRTPEPAGTVGPGPEGAGLLFVVHKHAARQLHFDLRLEMEGVLRSWAVPKGPSYDPADKRLAVHVEDHPIEYGDFEGLIPEGNYGAGAVIVWDRGQWVPHGDPMEGLEKGKLLFELRGFKLRGMWTLVKLKKSERDWLLIKERDQYVRSPGTDFPEGSVLSGLTVEDLKEGHSPAGAVRRELTRLRAPARPVKPETVELMLAETADRPFSRPGWVFELKLDGYRILAAKSGPLVRLLSRNGNDLAASFPEVVRAVSALPFERVLLDGEIVTPDDAGRPSFQRLQGRARLRRSLDVRRAAIETPATFYAFDLLGF